MVSSLSSFLIALDDVALGVVSTVRLSSVLSACVGSESFERLSRESIRACVNLLRGLLPSDEPDVHWLLVELPVALGGVFAVGVLLGDSCFRSLSTTPSPKDTVFLLLDIVPGVTRILFVGEAIVFWIWPASTFLAAVSSPTPSLEGRSREILGSLVRLAGCSLARDTRSVWLSSAPGVPNRALLKARSANTGAGVSGGSWSLELSRIPI